MEKYLQTLKWISYSSYIFASFNKLGKIQMQLAPSLSPRLAAVRSCLWSNSLNSSTQVCKKMVKNVPLLYETWFPIAGFE